MDYEWNNSKKEFSQIILNDSILKYFTDNYKNMKRLITILSLIVLTQLNINAQTIKSQNIKHAECLFELNDFTKSVSIKDCNATWKWTFDGKWYICEQLIDEFTQMYKYKVVYKFGNKYIVSMAEWGGGGNGFFTKLYLIQIKGNVITLLDNISENAHYRGLNLESTKIAYDYLIYSVYITPYNLMSWYSKPAPNEIYDACNACSVATAKYRYNPYTRQRDFIEIELQKDYSIGDDHFMEVYKKYIQNGKIHLKADDLKIFIAKARNK